MLRKVLKKVDFLKIVKLSTKSNNKSLLKKSTQQSKLL